MEIEKNEQLPLPNELFKKQTNGIFSTGVIEKSNTHGWILTYRLKPLLYVNNGIVIHNDKKSSLNKRRKSRKGERRKEKKAYLRQALQNKGYSLINTD